MAEWRRDPLLPLRRPAIARPTKVLTSSSNEINVTSHSLPRLIDFQPQVSTFTPANIDDKNDTNIKHGVKIDVRFELDTHNGNVDYKELQFPKMSTATKTGVPAVETRMAAAKKNTGSADCHAVWLQVGLYAMQHWSASVACPLYHAGF